MSDAWIWWRMTVRSVPGLWPVVTNSFEVLAPDIGMARRLAGTAMSKLHPEYCRPGEVTWTIVHARPRGDQVTR